VSEAALGGAEKLSAESMRNKLEEDLEKV